MPYDKSNQIRTGGRITEKWITLLNCFGSKNLLDMYGNEWTKTAELIKKTNSKHSWNLKVNQKSNKTIIQYYFDRVFSAISQMFS